MHDSVKSCTEKKAKMGLRDTQTIIIFFQIKSSLFESVKFQIYTGSFESQKGVFKPFKFNTKLKIHIVKTLGSNAFWQISWATYGQAPWLNVDRFEMPNLRKLEMQ